MARKRNDDAGPFGFDATKMNLFDDVNLGENIDQAEVITIDTDDLDNQARLVAEDLVTNFKKYYYDDEFINSQPTLKKNLELELENLRMLIKMKKSDEIMQDLLVRACGQQSTNASLYKSLTTIQQSIRDIQKDITETIKRLNGMLKNVQLELNFKEEQNQPSGEVSTENDNDVTVSRGTKSFIEQLRQAQNIENKS